jgi:hypothetical protein
MANYTIRYKVADRNGIRFASRTNSANFQFCKMFKTINFSVQ